MSRRHWSPKDHEEYRDLMEAAFTAGSNSHERIDAYEALLADAIQTHRPWARDIERECLRQGANREVTAYGKRREPEVRMSYNGRIIHKSRRRGAVERLDDGSRVHQQALWEDMSWEQLDELMSNRGSQIRALSEDVRIARRLMALNEAQPHTTTVGEALAVEGVSLDQWLGTEASA